MSEPSRSERIAAELRDSPPRVDEIARARAEKRLIDAVVLGVGPRRVEARKRPIVLVAAASLSLAAAAAVLFVMSRGDDVQPAAANVATFEALDPGAPVRRGSFAPGEVVETTAAQRVRVRIDRSEVLVAPSTRVRFSEISAREVRLTVERGRVDVGFHPRHRGEQRMRVLTRTARVEVVGTVFRVVVDARGETAVSVSQGAVRVVDLRVTSATLVRAGSSTRIALAPAPASGASGTASAAGIARAVPGGPVAAPTGPPTAPIAAAPDVAPAERASPTERLVTARALIARDPDLARTQLTSLATDPRAPASVQAGALMDLGNIARTAGHYTQAEAHFAVAAHAARGTREEANALYALGGVRERQPADQSGARDAYRLELAAPGAAILLPQIRAGLCRLGDAAQCEGAPR